MKVAIQRSKRARSAAEFKVVRLRECPVDSAQMAIPEQVECFWRKHVTAANWFKADKECLVVLLLNTRRRLIGFESLSQGTKDTVLVNTAEVFRLAAMRNAPAIIVAHNHPSGDPSPSEQDIKVTRDLIRAGALLKIDVLDHVVIGDARHEPSHASLKALGYFYDYENSPGYFAPRVSEPAEAKAEATGKNPASSLLEMERPVQSAIGLLQQFSQMICVTPHGDDDYRASADCGCLNLADECGKALNADWNAAHDARSNGAANVRDSIDRLRSTVNKSVTLLNLLANDLVDMQDATAYREALVRGKRPAANTSGYLLLAEDVVAALEKSFERGVKGESHE